MVPLQHFILVLSPNKTNRFQTAISSFNRNPKQYKFLLTELTNRIAECIIPKNFLKCFIPRSLRILGKYSCGNILYVTVPK